MVSANAVRNGDDRTLAKKKMVSANAVRNGDDRTLAKKKMVRNVVAIIGNVISFGLFLSLVPTFAPTFAKIWKRRAVEEFSPVPYLATLLNCMLWVFYGIPFVHPHSILVVTINGVGFVLESLHILNFFAFSPNRLNLKVLGILAVELLFMAGVMVGAQTHEKRSLIVGVLCVFFGVCMYTSPLSIMKLSIQTRSVKYMSFFLSLVGFLNGICWTIYAFVSFDIFIAILNVLGAELGLAQMILYFAYYRLTPLDENKPDAQPPAVTSAVALSATNIALDTITVDK